MNKGSLEDIIELTPRRRMFAAIEGSPAEDNTERPDTWPARASVKLGVATVFIFSPLTVDTAPTTDPSFLAEP